MGDLLIFFQLFLFLHSGLYSSNPSHLVMAHQPHNIPWSSLTSNLRWAPASRKTHHIADYHPQGKPTQGDNFTHFVKKFVECLKEQSKQERKKYPEAFQRPDDNEDIIGDAITAKIFPTIRKWRKHADSSADFDCSGQFCCKSSEDPPCCPILHFMNARCLPFAGTIKVATAMYSTRSNRLVISIWSL